MNRLYRTLGTGIGFVTFGLMGLLFQFIVFPPILLFVRDVQLRHRIARWVTHKSFYAFICLMRLLGVWSWKTENIDTLRRPGQLILANHLTLVDVVFLIAFIPNASAIVKAALVKNPFTWAPLKACGYVANNEGPQLVNDCVREIQNGSSLVIFPEGTRTPPNQTPKLKRGAMVVALEGKIAPTIVQISCEPLSLTKGNPWWNVPERPMFFTIKVCGALSLDSYQDQYKTEPSKATRALTAAVYDAIFSHYRTKDPQR